MVPKTKLLCLIFLTCMICLVAMLPAGMAVSKQSGAASDNLYGASYYIEADATKSGGSLYNLTIELSVKKEGDEYLVLAEAKWENETNIFTRKSKKAESDYFDYMSISWGGEEHILAKSETVHGRYWKSGDEVAFAKSKSDSYSNFEWLFNEKRGGHPMQYSAASVELKPVGQMQNKTTQVKFTYTHTYGAFQSFGSVKFDITGYAPNIIFKQTENMWQLEIAVDGIKY